MTDFWDDLGSRWSKTWRNPAVGATPAIGPLALLGPIANAFKIWDAAGRGVGSETSKSKPGSSAWKTRLKGVGSRKSKTTSTAYDSPLNEVAYEDYLASLNLGQDQFANLLNSILNGGSAASYMGTPRDMTQDWLGQLQSIYGPQVDYAQSVIPYLEQQGANAKGEIVDLYNIAEAGLNESAEDVRTQGQAAAAEQAQNIAAIVDAMQADTGATEADYLAELEHLGISPQSEAAEVGQEQAELLGREGGFINNQMATDSAATADYISTLASIQDSAAAAHVADMANQINDLIFQQQGRITDIQSAQAQAALDIMMRGRADYLAQIDMAMQGDQNRLGNYIDLANLQRGLYGDYMGYAQQGYQNQLDYMSMLGQGEGAEYAPPQDYYEAASRASGGNAQIEMAFASNAGLVMDYIANGNHSKAIEVLTNAGVPVENATQFVLGMLGAYG